MRVLCIGAGYVGGPTMAVIAAKCPDIEVVVADIDRQRVQAWQSGEPPIYEPGLREVVREALNRNLSFTTDVAGSIEAADVIFVSVNTPTKMFGEGAGRASDLQYWEATARTILTHARTDKIVVEKSTLPVRTAEAMARILHSKPNGVAFDVLSNPEFLAEGSAIRDLEEPDRVLIGGEPSERGRRATDLLAGIYARWVPPQRILKTNVWSSELSKLAANAMLAQRVSSINALSELCEATEADVAEVARAVGMDRRIGHEFLRAGVGFGGSCFKKDILNLVYLCEHFGLQATADYWLGVVRINEHQQRRFARNIVSAMFNTLVGKRIAVLGFAFKADTGDTRESPANFVCRRLVEERARVVVTDPRALDNARRDLADLGDAVAFEPDPMRAVEGAHAFAVLTDWELYRDLDYRAIYQRMEHPAFCFDGRNLVDHRALFDIGFNVYPIGKVPLSHLEGGAADRRDA